MDRQPNRVMIIGFDGATLDLIRPWAEDGTLPNLQRLMKQGSWGPLRTITPPITPTAWSSFLTGMNPGKHGLFDFTGHKKNSYDTFIMNASNRHAPSLWQLASRAGRRVTVFNVPVTYPPEKVNGSLVSGLLTPAGATDASWPPSLQKELEEAVPGFNFSPPGMYSKGQDVQFVGDVRRLNQITLDAARYLMKREPWDLFVTIFMGTDIMQHFMWKHMASNGSTAPQEIRDVVANAIKNCYRDLDAALGELMKEAGEDVYTILMSDHGFGPMDSYMSVNSWLIDTGYIKFKRNPVSQLRRLLYRLGVTPLNVYDFILKFQMANTVRKTSRKNLGLVKKVGEQLFLNFHDVDWSRTRAYSNGYAGPIFINLKGREPGGIVEPGAQAEAVLNEIIADLKQMKHPKTGEPFVGEIYRGSEIYSGPNMEQAPDLIFFPRDWRYMALGLVDFPSNRWLNPSPDRSGHHRMDGVVMLNGAGIKPGNQLAGASIMDIAPTVLALMGIPIPEAMDGHVLEAAIKPDVQQEMTVSYGQEEYAEAMATVPAPELSEEEEEIIRTRLRNLGYID